MSTHATKRRARRHTAWIVALALIALLLAPLAQAGKPNIVFIITDDQLPNSFNFLPAGAGRNLTPNLDRLAAEGTVLMGQHVASPVCTPSRYNCLTGNYASRSTCEYTLNAKARDGQSVVQWNTFITPADTTLPKLLREAGYRTGAVGKNHVIECPDWVQVPRQADPTDPAVKARLLANAEALRVAYRQAGFDYAERLYHHNPHGNGPDGLAVHNLDWIAEGARNFIADPSDAPFFLYVATTAPHGPRENERSWNADPRLTPEGILETPPQGLPPRESIPARLKAAGLPVSTGPYADREDILWIDDLVGSVIDGLRKKGVLDNTLIVYFNDHGQLAKGTLYQGGVANPSVIWRQGGFPCGTRSDALVSNIDFMPTLLEYAGVDASDLNLDGRSFASVLRGDAASIHDYLYFELGYARAVRRGDWKYLALRYPEYATAWTTDERRERLATFNASQKKSGGKTFTEDATLPFSHITLVPGGGAAEHASYMKYPAYCDADQLYNLAADPREQHNLEADPKHAEILRELRDLMHRELLNQSDRFTVTQTQTQQR